MPRAIVDRASSAAALVMDPNTRQTTAAARRIRVVGSDIYFAPAYCISVLRIGGSALEWRRSSPHFGRSDDVGQLRSDPVVVFTEGCHAQTRFQGDSLRRAPAPRLGCSGRAAVH